MTPILAFDIETVPDVAGVRRLRPGWASLPDRELAQRAFDERREKTGIGLPAAASAPRRRDLAVRSATTQGFRVRSIGQRDDAEARG